MKEQIVSKAYAQAIFNLGKEQNVDVSADLTKLQEAINSSNNFETLLFSDVFTLEEKAVVLNDVVGKLKITPVVKSFLTFLVEEKRINILPMIYKNVVVLDDNEKGFLRGTIEGAGDSADDAFLKKIQEFLTGKLGKSPELNYVKNEKLTAGYRVTVDDLQLDASLENQLNKFKEQVLNS